MLTEKTFMMPETPVRSKFPRKVREIENTWIPMPDGTCLAARIWLPEDADDDPVPAILEYLPYRKRDDTAARDQLTHPYFAGFGYAAVRVDMRGTGDSEGVCLGEYLVQEQDDCLAVIQWLAAQSWCSAQVGMIGISWGGFNALQVAARRPKALRAVISLCSTDDRYADDIHFLGGAVLTEKLSWGATAFAIVHTPPDPALVGERWRDLWKQRLDENGLWLFDWFTHQRRDEFYTHGSIAENYGNIEIPVYLVGGWADSYTNTILRMLEHLKCPKKGLIGPWAHNYPHLASPGPRIGFLKECLRFWDQHLKGIDTQIMSEPQLRAWIHHPVGPAPHYQTRPGHWVTVREWRANSSMHEAIFPQLQANKNDSTNTVCISTPQTTGHTAGNWCEYGEFPDGPIDQNGEADMICFETVAFAEDLDILGHPVLYATVASDVAQANLVAVLSEVLADGKATRISYGVLNLAHRNSHAQPEPMGEESVEIQLKLNACGQRIGQGNRLRLALSTSYWPIIWPAPVKATLKLSDIKLNLPLSAGEMAQNNFQHPQGAPPLDIQSQREGSFRRSRNIDYVSGIETCETYNDSGLNRHLHTGIQTREVSHDTYSIHPDRADSAVVTCHRIKQYCTGKWRAGVEAKVSVRATEASWQIDATLIATDADGIVADKTWSEVIDRDYT